MLTAVYGSSGRRLDLKQQIGVGGEAEVFEVIGLPMVAVKIYHKPALTQRAKLEAMQSIRQPMFRSGDSATAWPSDLVFSDSSRSRFLGFAMDRLVAYRPVHDLLSQKRRREIATGWNYRYSLATAANLCSAVAAVHEANCIVGDLNSSNVFSHITANVRILDADSFQLGKSSPATEQHKCTVIRPEYCPPELIGRPLDTTIRSESQDYFSLAVLVFQLLTDRHPFDSIVHDDPDGSIEAKIRNRRFPYAGRSASAPPGMSQRYEELPNELRRQFETTFVEGHQNPALRATASALFRTLSRSMVELTKCSNGHEYWRSASECRFCTAAASGKATVSNTTASFPSSPVHSRTAPTSSSAPPSYLQKSLDPQLLRVVRYRVDGDVLIFDENRQGRKGGPSIFYSADSRGVRKFYGDHIWINSETLDPNLYGPAILIYRQWLATQPQWQRR